MRIAFLALIAISLLATLANADKEVQKAINKEKKLVKPILLKPQPLKRVQHRLPPRPPQPPPQLRRHHTPNHHSHPKIPTSALKTSASVRHSRKIKAPIHPKGQKVLKKHKIPLKIKGQKRRRVYKQNNNVVQSKKPSFAPQKISNFNRFLRFFGRQIQRPVFPIHENRRKFNIRGKKKPHPLVLTKAENIAGYEKFTLDEVIYPDEDKKEAETVKERSDQEDDIVLVDGINPRNVNGADKKDIVEEEKVVKKVEKEAVVENSDVR